jgi:hypothetical protein
VTIPYEPDAPPPEAHSDLTRRERDVSSGRGILSSGRHLFQQAGSLPVLPETLFRVSALVVSSKQRPAFRVIGTSLLENLDLGAAAHRGERHHCNWALDNPGDQLLFERSANAQQGSVTPVDPRRDDAAAAGVGERSARIAQGVLAAIRNESYDPVGIVRYQSHNVAD